MGVLVPAALLYVPAVNLGQKRQLDEDLSPQAHSHLPPAIRVFPGPGVEAGMEGSRGHDGVCASKRSAWPGLAWAAGGSGGLQLAPSSVPGIPELQEPRGLPPSPPFYRWALRLRPFERPYDAGGRMYAGWFSERGGAARKARPLPGAGVQEAV